MSLLTRIARNSFWLLTARIGAQASMVIITYLLARRLGTAGFGEYAFIATAIVIGNTLTTFGSDMYLIRELAANSDFSELPAILVLQLALSLLFIGFVYLLSSHLPNQTPASIMALKIYSFALMPLAFFTVFTSMLRGAQKMTAYAWLNFVIPIVQVVAISVLIQRGTGIVLLAYLLLGIQIIGAILGGIFCAVIFPGFWRNFYFAADKLFSLITACLPIALIAILGIIYQKLSITMLSFLGGASMVGLFSAAARALEIARIGHFAALTALYPVMAESGTNQDSIKAIRTSWLFFLILAGAGSIFLFLFARDLVLVFFGNEYLPSISVLKIISFTLIPYTVNSFLSLAFLAARQEKVIVRILLASTLVLLFLNVWWIPRRSLIGAGWAILIAEIVQSILFLLAWRIRLPSRIRNTGPQNGGSYELPDISG